MQTSDAGTETDRQNSKTGTVTGDDRRDRQEVWHLEHVTVMTDESARTVQNRQDGQTGTDADSHRHLTGSVPGSRDGVGVLV